ncbi:acyl-CoA dehydrogenase family protein [Pararoseomonas sp. SCSIO 73927]|uniref:acyl-CoA dehydrogenase family protein n=1 Tax=Pararoseomonas sp. SCSIO 73927 TaxID=3114537 RepID=UPI0030CC5573
MIDFAPDDAQLAVLDSVDRFLRNRLPVDEIRRRDRMHIPPYDLLPEMGDLGLFRLALPEEHGGLGMDWRSVMLVQEKLGRHAYMVASIFNRVVGFGIASVLGYGTAEQREALLPRLADGQLLIALALTEPEAGTDACAIRTRAVPVPGGWRINGRKTWISDARCADYLLVPVRTAADSSGTKGISLLLVPPSTAGVNMTLLEKIGNNCMPSWDIGFDDVFVPSGNLMGQEGEGFRHMMSTLHNSRASMAATVTGCAQAAVDCAVAHAKERAQFGRPIGSFQSVRHRLANMQMRVDQSRLTVWHLGWLLATGQRAQREASAAKIIATETLQYVTHHGMQILASAGYSAESDMQRFWRDGRLYTFGEGANEIQREIVARELGL